MIRYGIIGCGMMGQEHMRNIALLDGAEVGAIYEPNGHMRRQAQALAPQARVAEDVPSLVAGKDIDCLVIASPNFLHIRQLLDIAGQRTLPILVEKPLATQFSDREHILHLIDTYEAPIWVAMEYRYMPPLTKFREMVDDVTGGVRMLSIREHRFPFLEKVGSWNRFNRYTGGTLVEKCCHFFDLMRLIVQANPLRVMASGGQMVNHLDESYLTGTSDIWDSAFATVDFDTGARAMLELCMYAEGSEYQEAITAIGPQGKIECLIPGPSRFWPEDAGPEPKPKLIVSPRGRGKVETIEVAVDETLLAAGDHHGSTFYQHAKFRDVVHGTADVEVTLDDGWWAVAMGLAAQQSAQEHSMIDIRDMGLMPDALAEAEKTR